MIHDSKAQRQVDASASTMVVLATKLGCEPPL
jgi:hypothetical protein